MGTVTRIKHILVSTTKKKKKEEGNCKILLFILPLNTHITRVLVSYKWTLLDSADGVQRHEGTIMSAPTVN